MKVHLRKRSQKKGKRISLYLEYYKGSRKSDEGKVLPIREYEHLGIFLHNKPSTPLQKQENKQNIELAKNIKSKREIDIKNNEFGFLTNTKSNSDFLQYFNKLTEDRLSSIGNYGNWDSTLKHLNQYTNGRVLFKEIDDKFCEGFKNYLTNKVKKNNGECLSSSSVSSYFNKFRASLKQAVKDKIILYNPSIDVKIPKVREKEREYLTIEEVRQLEKVECRYEVLKRAFLFSCLTGLRWSDIYKLKWKEIHILDNGGRIHYYQKKTENLEYLDISEQALSYIGEKGKDEDNPFEGLKYSSYFNVALAQWMLKAGITKDITFHCARHTHATLLLANGVDIYTVSKLLGHKEIKTTQVYARIIDKNKKEAVNKIPSIKI
ncbi:MAG: site-specific integrase [Lentimicrobiaceae bacterium]|jgi:integrase|nr:site-specific integrase [Lentimicrobiaceae bacterium]